MGKEIAEETSKAQGIVIGILSCSEAMKKDEDEYVDLAEVLLSTCVANTSLSDMGIRQLAKFMIEMGFDNNVQGFILEFRDYQEELHNTGDAFNTRQQAVLDQFMLESMSIIASGLNDGTHCGYGTIEEAVTISTLISDSNNSAINHLIRLCGKAINAEIIDQYCKDHPYGYNPGQCFANDVREKLLEGLFKRLGFWKIWLLVRRFFIGKNPEKAIAEMEKEQEIAIVHAQILELWRYPVNLDDPNLEKRMAREAELFARLGEIDFDSSATWFEGNAPNDRRAD